tara:strand:- start:1774 stop:1938 length:165 start_codon:yes stop_codon:yes gene_type:complete
MGIEIRVKFENGNAESMFFTQEELAKAKRIFNKVLNLHKDENVEVTWKKAQVIY